MSKLIILLTIASLIDIDLYAQVDTTTTNKKETEIFLPVDKTAEFPGGFGKFYQFIAKNLKYPDDAKKDQITGKVLIEFVINKDGSIDDESIKIIEGLSESCDSEAVRLMKECPNWIPATIKKEPVKQRYRLPITFKI